MGSLKEHVSDAIAQVDQESAKQIKRAQSRALRAQETPLHFPLGRVELIARKAEQMSIAVMERQVGDAIDHDFRFKEHWAEIKRLERSIKELVKLKEQYWHGIEEAKRYLRLLREESEEITKKLRDHG